MNHLIFDVETTGFFNPKVEFHSKAQARVIQLACIKLNDKLEEVDSFVTLIKPEKHFVMNEGAFKQHGISLKDAELNGISHFEMMERFFGLVQACDYLVAHNFEFDYNMMQVEYANHGITFEENNSFCTMDLMTNVCKLPHKNPKRTFGCKYKWPKLEEAIEFVSPDYKFKSHNALEDCKATAEIYKYLIKTGRIQLPTSNVLPISS